MKHHNCFKGPLRTLLFLLLLASLLLLGCGKKRASSVAPMPRVKIGYEQRGIASWYGHPYHGRATASGEVYDMERLTAAHQRLPFGVITRVENLSNGKTVDVRINDRGPFVKGRIIDLSRAAARRIDLLGPGIVQVRLRVIDAPPKVRAALNQSPQRRWSFLRWPLHPRRSPTTFEEALALRPDHHLGDTPSDLERPTPQTENTTLTIVE